MLFLKHTMMPLMLVVLTSNLLFIDSIRTGEIKVIVMECVGSAQVALLVQRNSALGFEVYATRVDMMNQKQIHFFCG